ncbi:MAG: hypothetical protein ACXWUE_30185 [Polyangiales bacterium]
MARIVPRFMGEPFFAAPATESAMHRLAPFPLVAALVFGCGSSAPDPGSGGDAGSEETVTPADGCTELEISSIRSGISGGGGASVVANPKSSLGGDATDQLSIELIPAGTTITTGTFDLSKEIDYGSCHHCVALYVDGLDAGTSKSMFFQEKGTLVLSALSSPLDTHSTGSIADLKLVEVTVDKKTFATKKVEGGRCYTLKSATWNTVLPKGGACTVADDCADPTVEVCDPSSGKCVAGQCGSGMACAAGESCVYQSHGSTVGACYKTCAPFASGACPDDSECVVAKFDGSEGYCKKRGTGAADSSCSRSDRDTGCVAGHLCDSVDKACRAQCNFFGGASCPSGQHCVPPGVCTPQTFDAAKVGDACSASAKLGDACGATDGALTGVCAGSPLKCAKWCRSKGSDCATGQSCQATSVPSIGYCG